MRPSNIPNAIRREILRRKFADLRVELAGIKDVLAKSLGSKNAVNVVKATFEALKKLRTRSEILAKRDRNAL